MTQPHITQHSIGSRSGPYSGESAVRIIRCPAIVHIVLSWCSQTIGRSIHVDRITFHTVQSSGALSHTLPQHRKIPASIVQIYTDRVIIMREWISQIHTVLIIDDSVTILIHITDISGPRIWKFDAGRINLFLRLKISIGFKTIIVFHCNSTVPDFVTIPLEDQSIRLRVTCFQYSVAIVKDHSSYRVMEISYIIIPSY